MLTFMEKFIASRMAATPLVAIRTADPTATMKAIALHEDMKEGPMLMWDCVTGLNAINEPSGKQAVQLLIKEAGSKDAFLNPVEMLVHAAKMPKETILFMMNLHRFLNEPPVVQAVWNLRDSFKQDNRTLVILCPAITLPPELSQDISVLDEPFPDSAKLAMIVAETYAAVQLAKPDKDKLTRAVDALCGLAAFPAEQVCAECISKEGLDFEDLWERKRQQVEMTPGLSVWRGKEKFSDIGGLKNIKQYILRVLKGRRRISEVMFIDEIEKMLAGSSGDMSGVSQEMLGAFLTWMQNNNVIGIILIGPPGTGKSLLAKAAGNEAGIPTVTCDLSSMKGSLVGESQQHLMQALKVIDAVGGENTKLVIATCNSIDSLPPELRRRFRAGTWFMDLPDITERESIWKYYLSKYKMNVAEKDRPADSGWTGSEIEQCVDLAWSLNITLKESSEYVVPVAESAKESVRKLRELANGRFISASKEGKYQAPAGYDEEQGTTTVIAAVTSSPRRKINTDKSGLN